MFRRRSIVALVLALVPAVAGATEVLLDSQAPFWEVGPHDNALSRACSIGRFNERAPGRYVIRLHARKGGAEVLGVAKGSGLNLADPDHQAKPGEDYYFLYDGTSNCRVFVGGRQPAPKK
jgi:hypothetical protein